MGHPPERKVHCQLALPVSYQSLSQVLDESSTTGQTSIEASTHMTSIKQHASVNVDAQDVKTSPSTRCCDNCYARRDSGKA
eukprot:3204242-Amphidinium_carterae.1